MKTWISKASCASAINTFAFAVALCVLAAGSVRAADEGSPLPQHFPVGKNACFGRTYDASHLADHPKQRVTSLYLFRDLTPDLAKEDRPDTPEEQRIASGVEGNFSLMAYVRFRDKPGKQFWHSLGCRKAEDGRTRCGIDCDGGSFVLKPQERALLLENNGFTVIGGCGESEEEAEQRDFVAPGADDKLFRLDPERISACTAIRDSLKPAYVKLGSTLRERFSKDGAVCFERKYDGAHLAKHGGQTIKRISVLKDASYKPETDYPVYQLTFRIETKGGERFEKKTSCAPDNYAYACTHDLKYEESREFYLTRAGNDAIMLRDKRGWLSKMFETELGADDKLFKLQAAPAAACEF
jgi:hypothetical protein